MNQHEQDSFDLRVLISWRNRSESMRMTNNKCKFYKFFFILFANYVQTRTTHYKSRTRAQSGVSITVIVIVFISY